MGVKLKTIATQTETYHPLLMSFSFKHLLETITSYLEVYLEKNPSDDLLKVKHPVCYGSKLHKAPLYTFSLVIKDVDQLYNGLSTPRSMGHITVDWGVGT